MKTAIMSLMIWSWLKNNCSKLLELSQWMVKQICQECGPTVKFPYFLIPQSTLTSKIIYGKLQPNSILKWMDAYGWRKFNHVLFLFTFARMHCTERFPFIILGLFEILTLKPFPGIQKPFQMIVCKKYNGFDKNLASF